jgi:hypothetical protein
MGLFLTIATTTFKTQPLDTPAILKPAEGKSPATSRAFSFYNEWHEKCAQGKSKSGLKSSTSNTLRL